MEADGISFNAETVEAVRITEDAEYEGVRVRVHGSMGNARISIQIDIGFGDVIVPNEKYAMDMRLCGQERSKTRLNSLAIK